MWIKATRNKRGEGSADSVQPNSADGNLIEVKETSTPWLSHSLSYAGSREVVEFDELKFYTGSNLLGGAGSCQDRHGLTLPAPCTMSFKSGDTIVVLIDKPLL